MLSGRERYNNVFFCSLTLMQSPRNSLQGNLLERTAAVQTTIRILDYLFVSKMP